MSAHIWTEQDDEVTRRTWRQRAQSLGALFAVCVTFLAVTIVASILTKNTVALYVISYILMALVALGLRRTPWMRRIWCELDPTRVNKEAFSLGELILIGATLSAASSVIGFALMHALDTHNSTSGETKGVEALVLILFAPFVGPVIEEVVCRGVMYPIMRRGFGVWTSAIVTSIVFAFAHLNIYQIVPTLVVGVVLALIYEKTRVLIAPIVIHIAHNVTAMMLALIEPLHHLNIIVAAITTCALWVGVGWWTRTGLKRPAQPATSGGADA